MDACLQALVYIPPLTLWLNLWYNSSYAPPIVSCSRSCTKIFEAGLYPDRPLAQIETPPVCLLLASMHTMDKSFRNSLSPNRPSAC